ncbi:vacuolar-type H+-ATPase subunit H [soil metagenome]
MTNNVVVDQAGALDLIDQLRVAVPEEVRQAKRINQETERILENAQGEAERIVARAQEQAAFLIEERELTRAADVKSREIIEDGRSQAEEIRRGADAYAASVLVKLEGECVKALQSIKRGIDLLDERSAAAESAAEAEAQQSQTAETQRREQVDDESRERSHAQL